MAKTSLKVKQQSIQRVHIQDAESAEDLIQY